MNATYKIAQKVTNELPSQVATAVAASQGWLLAETIAANSHTLFSNFLSVCIKCNSLAHKSNIFIYLLLGYLLLLKIECVKSSSLLMNIYDFCFPFILILSICVLLLFLSCSCLFIHSFYLKVLFILFIYLGSSFYRYFYIITIYI